MSSGVSVHEREVAIVTYLRGAEDGQRDIRSVWEALRQPRSKESPGINDGASLPTYHRTVNKLVRRGLVEEHEDNGGAAQFTVAEQLSPLNPYTLTDLETALWELSAPKALAQYLDAVDYYEANADAVLTVAAKQLLEEEPRELILRMLQDEVECLIEDVQDVRDPETDEPKHRRRTESRLRQLSSFVYGELGLGASVWQLPDFEALLAGESPVPPSWDDVKARLADRVFGDAFLELVKVPKQATGKMAAIVAGSDGSSHSGYVRGVPAAAYVEEEGRLVLTFNNSITFVDIPEDHPQWVDFPFHGVPMTRSALEDPLNRGMIVSRPWFPDLTDSEFEHMKKAALDVVQFRVDARLMTGTARAYGGSKLLPRPNVLIRDGTVTPQEREFQHYTFRNAYGDIVREGITLSENILREVADSEKRVFAGSVKSTQLRTFSRVINWYIKAGSRFTMGKPIDPAWDIARASHVTDNVAITRLLRALPPVKGNAYYRTCIVARPFPAMVTDLRRLRAESETEWLEVFERRRDRQVSEWKDHGGPRPWLASVDLADDHYVKMCQRADYGMFFFGRPGGDPQLTFPRFEFMDALRKLPTTTRRLRVLRTAGDIIAGVHATDWHLDRDHNFMSGRRLPRMIPYVVSEAHEKCKVLGHKLEAELRQAIAAHLSELKRSRRLAVDKVEVVPMPADSYVAGLAQSLPLRADSDEGWELPGDP